MASHPGARNAQSLFQKPSRNHGFIAAGLPRYAESSRTHLGLPAPVSISECPFIYVRPYIAFLVPIGVIPSVLADTNPRINAGAVGGFLRSEEHTSELQSPCN